LLLVQSHQSLPTDFREFAGGGDASNLSARRLKDPRAEVGQGNILVHKRWLNCQAVL
jgi:hypothetical protein